MDSSIRFFRECRTGMPFRQDLFKRQNFFHSFLRVVLAKSVLPGLIGLDDYVRRTGLTDSDELYFARCPPGRFGACRYAFPDGLQSQSDCSHNGLNYIKSKRSLRLLPEGL